MQPSTDHGRLLVLMAKQPKNGAVKTRLSPPLSPTSAAELYRCFLLDKLAQMRQVSAVRLAVAYSPSTARDTFVELAPDFTLIEQVGNDLAERLCNVFALAFDAGYRQVMAIDGDTPTLPPVYLQQGLDALAAPDIDVTLGPCEDGGYYAIGMKRDHPTLFDVAMSTPHVTRDTLARAAQADLEVLLLPEWYDIDRTEDLHRLQRELSARSLDGFDARATRGFFNEYEQGV